MSERIFKPKFYFLAPLICPQASSQAVLANEFGLMLPDHSDLDISQNLAMEEDIPLPLTEEGSG